MHHCTSDFRTAATKDARLCLTYLQRGRDEDAAETHLWQIPQCMQPRLLILRRPCLGAIEQDRSSLPRDDINVSLKITYRNGGARLSGRRPANLLKATRTDRPCPPLVGISMVLKEPCSASMILHSYALLFSSSCCLWRQNLNYWIGTAVCQLEAPFQIGSIPNCCGSGSCGLRVSATSCTKAWFSTHTVASAAFWAAMVCSG